MKITPRDGLFLIAIVALLGFLLMGKNAEKAANVPTDEKHLRLVEELSRGGVRHEIEKRCVACHGMQAVPLSKNHPPKEQCLLCHKPAKLK